VYRADIVDLEPAGQNRQNDIKEKWTEKGTFLAVRQLDLEPPAKGADHVTGTISCRN
jgi:hypothetical protein